MFYRAKKSWKSNEIKVTFTEDNEQPCEGGNHYKILLCEFQLLPEGEI